MSQNVVSFYFDVPLWGYIRENFCCCCKDVQEWEESFMLLKLLPQTILWKEQHGENSTFISSSPTTFYQSIYYFVLLWCFVKLYEEKKSLVYLTYEVLSEYCQDHKGFYLKTPL